MLLTTGLGMSLFVGATASNVPLPGVIESLIHGAAPVIRQSAGDRMPLFLLLVFGLTSLGLTGMGILYTIEALGRADYSVRVT